MTATPPSVRLVGVGKRFGDVVAVDDVSLDIPRGELFSLLGPSGCGKTTLLRLIAGLEAPDGGRLFIDGTDVTALPAHRRPTNMVFQHYALFPHLTVAGNVAFGFRYRGYPRREHARRIADALALVRLTGLEDRHPAQLSGGQRQRVALARALALEPAVLLLDEPLAALDRKLRRQVQVELRALQHRLGITFVFVTHDQEEALTLSDRVAVMNAGRVEQVDVAARVFERPRTAFVADFMGAGNFFDATVLGSEGERWLVSLPGGVRLALNAAEPPPSPGTAVRFVVRPERLRLVGDDSAASREGEVVQAVAVESRLYQGASTSWTVRDERGARFSIVAPSGRAAGPGSDLDDGAPGAAAWLSFHAADAVLLADAVDEVPTHPPASPSSARKPP